MICRVVLAQRHTVPAPSDRVRLKLFRATRPPRIAATERDRPVSAVMSNHYRDSRVAERTRGGGLFTSPRGVEWPDGRAVGRVGQCDIAALVEHRMFDLAAG